MGPVRRHRIASCISAALADVGIAGGLERLPYPLRATGTVLSEGTTAPRPELGAGQNQVVRDWVQSCRAADLWVSARTFASDDQGRARRVVAHRCQDTGYLAVQDGERVDLYRFDVRDIGHMVAEQIAMTGPGRHQHVIVPRYVGYFAALDRTPRPVFAEPEAYLMRPVAAAGPRPVSIPDESIAAVTVIQPRTTPATRWGTDWSRPAAVVITANGDGDYLYTPNHTHATPTDTNTLTRRITTLIAAQTPARLQMRAY